MDWSSAPRLEVYADLIAALPGRVRFEKSDLLVPQFRLFKNARLEIYYAPFDFVNPTAKVAIVGITPGWTQMEIAFRRARVVLRNGGAGIEASRRAKQDASFAGAMRKNLVNMLDEIGLQRAIGTNSCSSLFDESSQILHATSVIRYPTFVQGRNYTGYSPEPFADQVLAGCVEKIFVPELNALTQALIVPLGECVDVVMRSLIRAGVIDSKRCLLGFPHPSGLNGHRLSKFDQNRKELIRVVNIWENRSGQTS
jgi:hypothetical protein